MKNSMLLEITALSENENFARSAVAVFALCLQPSLEEISDIKTAVSEAVTNCVVHAYPHGQEDPKIRIECTAEREGEQGGVLHIRITDFGRGIENVDIALQPFYTTLEREERSGLGFTIMQTFCDGFSLESEEGKGTVVHMRKRIGGKEKLREDPSAFAEERTEVNA